MKLIKQLVLMTGGLILLTAPVMAEDMPGLYEAEVSVVSQDKARRAEAIKTALQRVLVRVTGRQSVLTLPAIEQAGEQANRYVQQFRYRNAASNSGAAQVLWLRFDKQAVDRLLRGNGLPVWGRTRPATLVWLVVDNRNTRQLLSNDINNQARRILEQEANLRGIPVRLPLMDLADRSVVEVSDVWGNFEDNLMQASARYQPEAVLVGRIFKTYSDSWNARWSLYLDGRQRQNWTASGDGLADVIRPGVNQVADVLAEQFTSLAQNSDGGLLRVRVTRVKSLADQNRVLKYLSSLSPVSEVRVHQIEPGSVVLVLTARRGHDAINQAISLGHTLRAEAITAPLTDETQAGQVELQYRLLP